MQWLWRDIRERDKLHRLKGSSDSAILYRCPKQLPAYNKRCVRPPKTGDKPRTSKPTSVSDDVVVSDWRFGSLTCHKTTSFRSQMVCLFLTQRKKNTKTRRFNWCKFNVFFKALITTYTEQKCWNRIRYGLCVADSLLYCTFHLHTYTCSMKFLLRVF